jgi:pyridoxamine 5'-phosphate oxidase-like protein
VDGHELVILGRHNILTFATVHEDRFPQATTVSYVNDGLTIYVGCGAETQKACDGRRCAKFQVADPAWDRGPRAALGLAHPPAADYPGLGARQRADEPAPPPAALQFCRGAVAPEYLHVDAPDQVRPGAEAADHRRPRAGAAEQRQCELVGRRALHHCVRGEVPLGAVRPRGTSSGLCRAAPATTSCSPRLGRLGSIARWDIRVLPSAKLGPTVRPKLPFGCGLSASLAASE